MLQPLILAAALAGHVAVWVFLFNRLNGSSAPRVVVKAASLFGYAVIVLVPPAAAVALAGWWGEAPSAWAWAYAACTAPFGLSLLPMEMLRRATVPSSSRGRTTGGEVFDLAGGLSRRPTAGWKMRLLSPLPYNELLHVEINHKELKPTRLPPSLEGLRILHLSDLHISGRLTREYYDALFDRLCGEEPDLALISGDILEKRECLAWAGKVLRRVSARYGVFYVLGNHDQRLNNLGELHDLLAGLGWRHLGGRSCTLIVEGKEVLLSGDERPWFGPGPQAPSEVEAASAAFRILLAHSPDRLPWARRCGYDLMLAGHTHGGQIRFPGIGPVICPSYRGVAYASGVFFEPPTLLHVVRGAASYFPIRFRCPHEATFLTLRSSHLREAAPAAAHCEDDQLQSAASDVAMS